MNLIPAPDRITRLQLREVFVFGSNLAGRHGSGAALQAKRFGAKNGQGHGHYGDTYAIPTKGQDMNVLSTGQIGLYVKLFLEYADEYTMITFLVTRIGCGLAGYKPEDIAPMFANAPDNVRLPQCFLDVLKGGK